MTCHFHVGQKVTLVRSFGALSLAKAEYEGVVLPTSGVVYTIREFDPDDEAFLCVRLCEITNRPDPSDGIEPSFQASLFRPLVERKTDISVFKEMLNYRPKVVVLS